MEVFSPSPRPGGLPGPAAHDGTASDGTASDGTASDGTEVDGTQVEPAGSDARDAIDARDPVDGYRAMLRSAASVLADVERALTALDEGGYGTCAECGGAIADEELASDPTTRSCASHRAP